MQLYQSLFQLTAGIAHEINTPIGIGITASSLIHGAGDLLASAVQNGMLGQRLLQQQLTDIKEGTELVESSLRRVALLVTRFKELTRIRPSCPPPLRRTEEPAQAAAGLHPRVSHRPSQRRAGRRGGHPDRPRVAVSRPGAGAHQEQHGARLQGAGEHRLTLQVERAGSELLLIYRDNGPGMAVEQLVHLFEPFFTTLRGDARHCGLSACRIHNLVENNLHGQLAVTSPPGEDSATASGCRCSRRSERQTQKGAAAPFSFILMSRSASA